MVTNLAIALLTVFCMSVPAIGQPLDCSQFRHNEDSSWTPIGQLTVTSALCGVPGTFPDRRGFDSIEEVVNDARQDRS
jgi:hypothetical protein